MLNQETKRKIDSARDILVGKVPDPKAQVEQITTALIYKFMDDMDKTSQELGGKARFFTNGYEKYAWTKLMDAKLGGHEKLDLYMEALAKLSLNPHIPQLFRDIFKDAFLPYRNPETLSLFLKEINGFTYEHSEDLGDSFEYLLSVLGSQGDAGQFRTPRHIIDFIVDVVNPKKDDTICDPACGTAGFLISAYKHILKQHDGKNDPENKEKPLTPDERKKLMDHFTGYDISPDMVRLSRVNLYLHGFPNPTIYEYDTLSSEEKWDESFDVMLANPPFMTPKGGIKPHKRFSVQANRSEVLFVDYILEHLRPNGRAGIIVPEGIIFQSGNAYKQLRKLLVEENYLWAVVSLPAGVFQPYSGVKTSILFLDRELAKKSDSVVFMKVNNDGLDLGAQRREIKENDLPTALMLLNSYKKNITSNNLPQTNDLETLTKNTISIFVPKSKIRELGDYYLTGERYKEINELKNQKWPMVELGDICIVLDSKRRPVTKADRKSGKYPYYGATGILDYVDGFLFDEKLVLVGEDGAKWGKGEKTAFIAEGKYWVNNHAHVMRPIRDRLIDEYLVPVLNSMDLTPYITGVTVPKLNQERLRSIKIPLPPIEVQKKIVEEVESYQKIIDAAKQIVNSWKPEIEINTAWELKKISEVAEINPSKPKFKEWDLDKDVFFLPMSVLDTNSPNPKKMEKRKLKEVINGYTCFKNDDVLLAKITPCFENGKSGIVKLDGVGFGSTEFIVIRADRSKVEPLWLWYFIFSDSFKINGIPKMSGSAGQKRLPVTYVENYEIPVPNLETQKAIIATLKLNYDYIKNTKENIIPQLEQKIQAVLEEI
ncbi:MAG: N-6 DNA methylase [Candidatus Levyibacteriota bacterium]|nr:MAG: N-6 DNA methylase [Candidatus Levybacteria bacterium]